MSKIKSYVVFCFLLSATLFFTLFLPQSPSSFAVTTKPLPSERSNDETRIETEKIMTALNWSTESILTNDGNFAIAMHYPLSGIKNIDSFLKTKYKKHTREFEAGANSFLNKQNNDQQLGELYADFWLYNHQNYITIVVNFYKIYSSQAHGINTTETYTFNLENGKEIRFQDLFESKSNSLALLSALSKVQLKKLDFVKKNADSPETKKQIQNMINDGTAPKTENFSRFALTSDGLTIFFEQYQVAPGAEGSIKITIPYKDLKSIWSSEMQNILFQTKEPETTEKPTPNPTILATPTPAPTTKPTAKTKYIALTFDDGPHSLLTPKLLQMLKHNNAKVTFFVLGNKVTYASKTVKQMIADGHDIGNHSYSHKKLTKLSEDFIKEEIKLSNTEIFNITQKNTVFFRQPYGDTNEIVAKEIAKEKMYSIFWNIDPEDWKFRDSAIISKHVIEKAKDGDIILLHDIYPTSVEAAEIIIKDLQKKDFVFVTISELAKIKNKTLQPGKVYHSFK